MPALAQQTLYVKSKQTQQPVIGAVVQYQKQYQETDISGKVVLPISGQRVWLQITHVGYHSFSQKVDFKKADVQTIFLEEKSVDLDEVTVKGAKKVSSKNVITTIKGNKLQRNTSQTLGDVLASVEGVSTIKSGATVVKPVIHGLHSNRIILLNNNVVHQGQDWGEDHAPEIDPFMANSITVVKGAEGVKYGANALGGVVLIDSKKLPYQSDKIQGNLGARLTTNGHSGAFFSMLEGSVKKANMAWRLQATNTVSGDLETAEYALNNTGTQSLNFAGSLGYKIEKLGVEAYYSRFSNKLGVFLGAHLGSKDDLLERFTIGRPLTIEPISYTIKAPKQEVVHHLAKVNAFWKPFEKGTFKIQYAFQRNDREEFNVRRLDRTKIPVLDMDLSTHSVSTSYKLPFNERWTTEIGGTYKNQTNYNVPGTGAVPVIPNFASVGFGAFAIQKFQITDFKFDAGIRFDYENLDVNGITKYSKRYQDNRKLQNLVYSLGASYSSSNWEFTTNFGVAWRAPHVSELFSEGVEHGTGIYKRGNKNLASEKGYKWITGASYQAEKLAFKVAGFVQKIDNYIYDEPSQESITTFSGVYPIFKYKQGDGFFRGIDFNGKYQFIPSIEYGVKASFVYATNLDNDGYFPFIPSENITQEIKFLKDFEKSTLSNLYCSLQHNFVAKQKRFNKTTELVASTPSAYHLVNFTAGITIPVKNKTLSVDLVIDNLTNRLYKEYTNRFRYYAHETGRNIQLKTIINF